MTKHNIRPQPPFTQNWGPIKSQPYMPENYLQNKEFTWVFRFFYLDLHIKFLIRKSLGSGATPPTPPSLFRIFAVCLICKCDGNISEKANITFTIKIFKQMLLHTCLILHNFPVITKALSRYYLPPHLKLRR